MPLTGTLRTWNDDRGFGFIAPTNGDRELFVHVSAFPRDGSRPTVGESLTYELGSGKDGKPRAVRVYRQAPGPPSMYPRARRPYTRRRRSRLTTLVGVALLIALGSYGYTRYQQHTQTGQGGQGNYEGGGQQGNEQRGGQSGSGQQRPQMEAPKPATRIRDTSKPVQPQYRCDGRTDCSQMTSCSEARFFLKNCPGTRMDGDNDGVPCEQQWCGSQAP